MTKWVSVLELDSRREITGGSPGALCAAIRRGADLRIYTEFIHNEHIDPASDSAELIREVSEFRATYLVEDRWCAGIMTLRQPISLPDAFGPRASMSFFMYNQDGQQAIARPYLDGVHRSSGSRHASGALGPAASTTGAPTRSITSRTAGMPGPTRRAATSSTISRSSVITCATTGRKSWPMTSMAACRPARLICWPPPSRPARRSRWPSATSAPIWPPNRITRPRPRCAGHRARGLHPGGAGLLLLRAKAVHRGHAPARARAARYSDALREPGVGFRLAHAAHRWPGRHAVVRSLHVAGAARDETVGYALVRPLKNRPSRSRRLEHVGIRTCPAGNSTVYK